MSFLLSFPSQSSGQPCAPTPTGCSSWLIPRMACYCMVMKSSRRVIHPTLRAVRPALHLHWSSVHLPCSNGARLCSRETSQTLPDLATFKLPLEQPQCSSSLQAPGDQRHLNSPHVATEVDQQLQYLAIIWLSQ